MPVFLESWSRWLLIAHALTAMALAGAMGHLAVASVARLRGKATALTRHLRTASLVYLACFALGLLLYPHFRYHVRALELDRDAPWASNLFDIKENLAALLLPLGLALPALETQRPRLAALFGVLLGVGTLALIIAGLLVTNTKGV
jgi:hypothetical protein